MFKGANKSPEIVPIDTTNYRVNYFTGKDKSKWKTGISTSKAVIYKNIYPYIDLKIYGKEKQIEYDWIVRPGGNPENIEFEYKNVKGTEIDKDGNIVIKTEFGELEHKRPASYQIKENGKREIINAKFKSLKNNIYKFEIENYDKNKILIIDPVVLIYSTYLGGGADDRGYCIAVDSSECAYVAGYTYSSDFPLQNPYQANYQGLNDVFITKLNSTGDGLIYSTYLGGSYDDWPNGIAVGSSKCAYITGNTSSIDFPLQNPYQTNYQGSNDAFITKLNSTGDVLIYSTYLGGGRNDCGFGIAVDSSECAYITGNTSSLDFPLQNPYQANNKGINDVFITKLNPTGNGLIYSTYLGGGDHDRGYGIAVDSSECAYVAGGTHSTYFPLQNPFQANNHGNYDAFITKLNSTGDVLIYSTYLGGGDYDCGYGIAVDSSECAYITGNTSSLDFPLQNPYQANKQWSSDAFITKLSFNTDLIIRASVSGGNGSATPSTQSVAYGSNASITITPSLGYEIASITDNGVLQTITNPYIIENIIEDHLVVVTFKVLDLIVRASVSGGNGSATPSTQSVAYGSNASITITPSLGYEIASITDNGVLQTITNPYIIENVTKDHLVIVTFKVSIRLSMTGVRKTERAWIIKRDYGELNFLVDNPSQVNVSKYVIYKKINNKTYEALYEFSDSSLNLGSYIYIDKFLNKDKTYMYKFIAYDSNGKLIALSNEISI